MNTSRQRVPKLLDRECPPNVSFETMALLAQAVGMRAAARLVPSLKVLPEEANSRAYSEELVMLLGKFPRLRRLVLEHVGVFLSDLKSRGKAPKTISGYSGMLHRLSQDCGWRHLGDVSARSFCEWRQDCGLHGETVNDYLSALSRFFNWLRRQRAVLENPVEFVERVDTRASSREYRRALTAEEVERLLAVTPAPRRIVYRMALETGLRRSELQRLRWADFRLGAGAESAPARPQAVADWVGSAGPLAPSGEEAGSESGAHPFPASGLGSVRVPASISKNRRTAVLPIGPELAEEIRSLWTPDTPAFQFVFAGLVPRLPRFRKDLIRAGITFVDESGRRVDLHALRKTFGTALVVSGAEPRVVMEVMRHSDRKLTMKTYTDASQLVGPVQSAIRQLPWNRKRGCGQIGRKTSPASA